MRQTLIIPLVLLPNAGFADPGHLGEIAGHSHWIALGALGLATAIGAWAAGAGKRKAEDAEAEVTDETPEAQEA